MSKNRIEAFSDGVIAIIITIMVLELHVPEMEDSWSQEQIWEALAHLIPGVLAYLLSFIVVAILWLNHHALFEMLPHSNAKLVWYNAFLLFSMSLIPLPTAFLAAHPLMHQAVMLYGFVLFLTTLAFLLLRHYVEVKAKMIPYNKMIQRSNWIGTGLYLVSIPLSLISVYLSFLIFIGVPIWYFLPDKFHKQAKNNS